MKKKGFTLIELIVVIAIIGVLAAILVPAMLGYVKKSKITSANSSAKSISTAAQSALTDMDTQDKLKVAKWDDTIFSIDPEADWNCAKVTVDPAADTNTKAPSKTNKGVQQFEYKVYTYFKDITKLTAVAINITKGNCDGVAVVNGNYPGTNPNQFSVDEYESDKNYGLSFAGTGSGEYNLTQLLVDAGCTVSNATGTTLTEEQATNVEEAAAQEGENG